MDKLREAVDQYDEAVASGIGVWPEGVDALAEFGRAVLDSEEAVNWCVAHRTQAAGLYVDGSGWCVDTDDDNGALGWDCEIDSFVLVRRRLLAEEGT